MSAYKYINDKCKESGWEDLEQFISKMTVANISRSAIFWLRGYAKQKIDKAIQVIDKIYNQVSELHPYKEPGNRDSYSEYNEGWSDACEEIRIRLIEELKKLKG